MEILEDQIASHRKGTKFLSKINLSESDALGGKNNQLGFCVIKKIRSKAGPFCDSSWIGNRHKMQRSDRRSYTGSC